MRRDVETPKDYLNELSDTQAEIVKRIRRVIRRVAPKSKEGLRYGMLDYPGLANLGAQKRYVALYVAPEILAKHKDGFPGVDAGKSCLRFRSLEQADEKRLNKLLVDVREFRADSKKVSEKA